MSAAQPLGWAYRWYLRRDANPIAQSRLIMISLLLLFIDDASKTDVRCSSLLGTFSSSTVPALSNVTLVHTVESIGVARLPQGSTCARLKDDAKWPGSIGSDRDGAGCCYRSHASCALWLPRLYASPPLSPPSPPPNAQPINVAAARREHSWLWCNWCNWCSLRSTLAGWPRFMVDTVDQYPQASWLFSFIALTSFGGLMLMQ